MGEEYILPAQLESLLAYAHSRRCGPACDGVLAGEDGGAASRVGPRAAAAVASGESGGGARLVHTPCVSIAGRRLQYLDRH